MISALSFFHLFPTSVSNSPPPRLTNEKQLREKPYIRIIRKPHGTSYGQFGEGGVSEQVRDIGVEEWRPQIFGKRANFVMVA